MPLTKGDIAYLLLPGVRTAFGQAYDNAPTPDYEKIATVIPSTLDTEKYGWLGSLPKMREWTDERQIKGLGEFEFSIKNKLWESSIGVERTAIEDDQYGQIRIRAEGLGREARRHPDELVFQCLMNAYDAQITGVPVATCFDGQPLASASHTAPAGGSAQSNYTTSALSATSLKVAMTAIASYQDDQGKPFGMLPDTLVVSPTLQWTAKELLQSTINVTKVGDGTAGGGSTTTSNYTNVLQGALNLIVTPYLIPKPYYWFVIASGSIVRPIIFQNRLAPEVTALENQSETAFMRDMYLYGVRARYNAGAGFWPAIHCNMATA
jgi:phage major head subunit gpT-like protein